MLKPLARCGLMLAALCSAPVVQAADDDIIAPTRIENVRVRDGATIAVAQPSQILLPVQRAE